VADDYKEVEQEMRYHLQVQGLLLGEAGNEKTAAQSCAAVFIGKFDRFSVLMR